MRAYPAASEAALHAREALNEWHDDGLLTDQQFQTMLRETPCDLHRTNIFLRIVFFIFTLLIAGAAVGLFFLFVGGGGGTGTIGALALFAAAMSYGAAEFVIREKRYYRHGIEEALAVAAVGLFCGGVAILFERIDAVPSAIGAILAVWVWHRFGLWYALLAAMVLTAWTATEIAPSLIAQRLIAVGICLVGLFAIAKVSQRHRFTFLQQHYSIAEAFLWLGIYLAINLQLFLDPFGYPRPTPSPFYWITWVLTWCVPPVILIRGIRQKDRYVIAAGTLAAILTLVTNKSYLGWPRHTWDPMLFGALLIGVSIFLQRWLAQGLDKIRRGFTAQRLSVRDKSWLSTTTAAISVAAPYSHSPAQHPTTPDVKFGGGQSGGGGASSAF